MISFHPVCVWSPVHIDKTSSHFFHSSPVDLLYAERMHSCSFVGKSNQGYTNKSHRVFTSSPPLNDIFLYFNTESLLSVASHIFLHCNSRKTFYFDSFWKVSSYVIFPLQRKFTLFKWAPLFSHTGTPPPPPAPSKVHSVSICHDNPP